MFQLVSGQLDNGEVLVAFRQDKNGQITHMFNGTWTHERLLRERAQQAATIELDPHIYDAYIGEYEIAPDKSVTITREGNKIFGKMTGQPKVELFPTSQTRFIIKVADAEINFIKDTQGQVTHLTLLLNGEEMRAKKVK